MNNIKHNFIDNVISYKISNRVKKEIDVNLRIVECNSEKNNYYILEYDPDNSTAFAHWVYECCVYIPSYLELKKKIPSLKVYLTNKRKYKDIFLKYLGVDINDIVYSIELPNTSVFHEMVSLSDKNVSDEYKIILDNFLNYFPKKYEKETSMLLMPRQFKENYIGNDRAYDTHLHEKVILEINPNNKILHTDKIEELEEQIKIVQGSETVVLTDGSPFDVNIIFAKKNNIIVLNDNIVKRLIASEFVHKYIIEHIIEKNELNIKYTENTSVRSLIDVLNIQ
jgi:hypothetical protein